MPPSTLISILCDALRASYFPPSSADSSNGFDAGQRAALQRLGITRVPGSGKLHAEEELLRGVPNLKRVGTSVRAPCGPTEHNCARQLRDATVEVES